LHLAVLRVISLALFKEKEKMGRKRERKKEASESLH
jgi:hypothetical protein